MHRVHGYPFHTHTRPFRPPNQPFISQTRNHSHALCLQKTLQDELLENLESSEPIHIDENNEWSVS